MHIENRNYIFIKDYLESITKSYNTPEFGYSSYTSPNTMFKANNDLPNIMYDMEPCELKVWLRAISLLKRNSDATIACTIYMTLKDCNGIGKTSFYKGLNLLIDKRFLIKTLKRSEYIVNPMYCNKLFNPKFEIPDISFT